MKEKKKGSARASSGKADKGKSAEQALRKELAGLVQSIDSEGLSFLIKQAQILLHNRQVEKINKDLQKLSAIDQKIKKDSRAVAAGKKAATSVSVDIEESGSNFILVMRASRKFLSLKEMRGLVQVCQAAESGSAAGPRLYRWFSRNRTDILSDGQIAGPADPQLRGIYELIAARYTTQG
ncbi:MAG: hypothetical protein GH155_04450 [Spirochaeta sp.]|nr:hypothetical protein [Spirochaeta sp.]